MQNYFIAIFLLGGLSVYLWRGKCLISRQLVQLLADSPMCNGGTSHFAGLEQDATALKLYEWESLERARLEVKLSGFVASAPGFFYSYRHGMDGSNTMPFASSGIYELFGLRPEDVAASIAPMSMRIHQGDLKSFIDETARSAADLSLLQIEFRTDHANKGELWIESRAMPVLERDGSIMWHGFMHDITPRKRTEQALLERAELEQRQSQFFNVAPGYFYTSVQQADGSFAMPFASSGIRDLFGLEPQDVYHSSSPITNLIHPEDRETRLLKIEKSLQNLSPFHFECRFNHPCKGLRWIEANSLPQRMPDGGIRWDGFMQDITERKLLEEQLARREQEFRTLAENSPDVLVRYDNECRFVYVNPLFEKSLGFKLEELRGKTPTQVPGLPEAEFFQQRVQEVIETGRADEFEHAVLTHDGMTIWALISIFPEFDADGRNAYVQVLSRNITSLKETEQQLENSRARLRQLLTHQENVHEHERMQMSWGMHEDLLQILASMLMYASLLNSGSGDVHQDKLVSGIISGLKTSIGFVRKMVESLRPTVLNLGIVPALEWLVDKFVGLHSDMVCQLEIDEETSTMDEKYYLIVFRIVQEVLDLAAKYRTSANANVVLKCNDEGYLLTLWDASSEYNIDMYDSNFFNLYSLQEQVLQLGGEMVIFSAPDHGLIIEARMPRC